ncbi:MAG: hypothetical protein GY757_13455 [bacterium]|nr:hypothetical protein [bacterium]
MANVTLSIQDNLLNAGREYARRQNVSLNALIRRLLEQTVEQSNARWLDECFHKMDQANGDSGGKKWRREDLYDD